jgi:hypothetical protein
MRRLFLLLLVTCSQVPIVPSPGPRSCELACETLHKLGCAEGAILSECNTFCDAAEKSGGAVRLQVDCVAGARSVEQVQQCAVDCSPTTEL